jgi:transketolase
MAGRDRDIFLLTSDLGFKLFDGFRGAYPDRFLNVGVAEANMIGVAAGMALEGKNVYCYSMVPFLTMRAIEQIRLDVCCHNLNVKLIGVGGGVTYGLEGYTHHGIEDVCVLRAFPNMTIVSPGDPWEAAALVEASGAFQGPLYIRLGGNNDPLVHEAPVDLTIGRGILVREGRDVTVCATGGMLHTASRVAERLAREGVEAAVVSMHTLKPLDRDLIRQCAGFSRALFTVEDHRATGGLGSAVAEILLELGWRGKFRKLALPDAPWEVIGRREFLLDRFGLSEEALHQAIMSEMGNL